MYLWLWRRLPGPVGVRVLIVATVLLAAVTVLFEVVFPVVAPSLPFNDGTITPTGS